MRRGGFLLGAALAARHESEEHMERRTLGKNGLVVSAQGLGCMGMSAFYAGRDDAESLATMERALDWDRFLRHRRDVRPVHEREAAGRVPPGSGAGALATKFGIVRDPSDRTQAERRRPRRQRPPFHRGQPPAARHRRGRPLLPPPGRPRDADRGDGGRDGASW